MRSQPRPHGSVWIKGIYVSTHAYIRLGEFLYTSRLSRIYAKPEVREIKYITLLSDRQFRIFEIIRQNPGCNATFLYESFRKKVTLRTIERDLASLRDKGVVVHTGSNKEGGYEVCTLNVVSME